jgi:hypothetical protein
MYIKKAQIFVPLHVFGELNYLWLNERIGEFTLGCEYIYARALRLLGE